MKDFSSTTREDAYRLLAACYYPPTPALLEEDCCDSLAKLLSVSAPEAAAGAAEASALAAGESLENLLVEHARLFVGPFHLVAPPYGSYHLEKEKTVMGESTEAVADFYASCGLHLAEDFHELPDHAGVELEFMSFLAYSEREALETGDRDEASRLCALQREFLTRFLLPWLKPFTAAILDDGEAPFYCALARCTKAFIEADYHELVHGQNG